MDIEESQSNNPSSMLDALEIPQAKIYHDMFSQKKIEILKEYFSHQPYSKILYDDENKVLKQKEKHSNYNIKESLPYKIIYPVLHSIIGDHQIIGGAYHEIYRPINLHVDNDVEISQSQHHITIDKNLSILIPLSEHPDFNTVFFNYFTNNFDNDSIVPTNEIAVDIKLFGHLSDQMKDKIKYLPIDKIFRHKLGDLVIWDRRQLHCATNIPHGAHKTQIILTC